jgi:protein-disulfide isomerase
MNKFSHYALVAVFGLLGGFAGANLAGFVGAHPGMDRAVHDYLLAHPEVLPEAVEALKAKEGAAQVAEVGPQAVKPWAGAVLGNPQGKHVLVEFMDFACGYCKASEADVARLIAADPQLQVVIRQLPILTPQSADAAKMALAAAAQGKYAAFHAAMFAIGHPSAQTIAQAASRAGLDMAAAQKIIASPQAQAELEANLAMARKLGINGTPSWIARGQLLGGAVGYDALVKALAPAD